MTTPRVPQSQGQHSTDTSEAMTNAGGLLPWKSLLRAVAASPLSRLLLSSVIGCGCRCLLVALTVLLVACIAASSHVRLAVHDVWNRESRGLHRDVRDGWPSQIGRVGPLQGPVTGRVGLRVIVEAASALVGVVAVHATCLTERCLARERTAAQQRRVNVPVQALVVQAREHG